MQKIKELWRSFLRNAVIILLIALISALSLFLLYLLLEQTFKVSLNVEKITYILLFVIFLCICLLALLAFHTNRIKSNFIALSCTDKITNEQYKEMIKTMTEREVRKLEQSKEFKEYMAKKNKTQSMRLQEEFSSGSESERHKRE